jgi:hypothetical protein
MQTLGKEHVTMSEVYASGAIDPSLTGWFSGRLQETGSNVDHGS